MVGPRSLIPVLGALSLLASSAVAGDVLASDGGADSCQCTPENQRVRYIVVEMPEQPPAPVVNAASEQPAPVMPAPENPGTNTTTDFGPCKAPDVDTSDPVHIVPAKQISLFYAQPEGSVAAANAPAPVAPVVHNSSHPFSNSTGGAGFTVTAPQQGNGQINMTMTTNNTFVALEYIAAVTEVACGAGKMTVTFADKVAFQAAADNWVSVADGLVLITNNNGNCDSELERGFYEVSNIVADAAALSISAATAAKKIEDIAGELEMTFSSLPAAQLQRRLTWDPKVSIGWGAALPEKKTLFSVPPYVDITADSAHFNTSVTFSGYLKFNFWKFKLDDLGAVGVKTQLSARMPAGNVHIDMKNKFKTTATGWNPKWEADAQISQKAEVQADVFASLKVELAVKILGGIIDLSSGLTAIPRVNNKFTLHGEQDVATGGSFTSIGGEFSQKKPSVAPCEQGVSLKSDFVFALDGHLTKYWTGRLYNVTVPITDNCWNWV
ncbi:hypothetical protein MAPG_09407 [Magnaporthiopsis poae ATCC 64411]|uniref:DUF7029 domain-containing protein n=1 Tax=Magnaporthiopsis poae (strain ATCC 64411 / 73-15) TaxID=644358 RepID=A0A0C4E9V7_MAGP6|nr:hypothetical protein MAPG_09407 [Magnaporthiopsis poae ATCC 64411]